jgi:hypothetical protein
VVIAVAYSRAEAIDLPQRRTTKGSRFDDGH